MNNNLSDILNDIDSVFAESTIRRNEDAPDRHEVETIINDLLAVLFPSYFKKDRAITRDGLIRDAERRLEKQIRLAVSLTGTEGLKSEELCDAFIGRLAGVAALLLKDIEALFDGDPAAKCREEVLLCYPGFYAIAIYRLAHELYTLNVPLLPRMMTESAHGKTGVDINAGAKIGEYFFIDHGTGIVIGETAVIGDHVKLYQGVTLGAKSFELDENGNPVKGTKRHPNIGNNVVIYANATILGGSTYIGDDCIIGGNVWLTSSVERGKTVYYKCNSCKMN